MADQWKPGDLVKLASGGPTMSVRWVGTGFEGVTVVQCEWFDSDGKPQSKSFVPSQLVAVK